MYKNRNSFICDVNSSFLKHLLIFQNSSLIAYIFILSNLVILCSCGGLPTVNNAVEPSKNKKIAENCNDYIAHPGSQNPDYFIPPPPHVWQFDQNNPVKECQDGRVAWTPSIYNGYADMTVNLFNYRLRLNKANNMSPTPTKWDDYLNHGQYYQCGFPGYWYSNSGGEVINVPTFYFQAGFVCYALVYNAIVDAKFNIFDNFTPLNCNQLLSKLKMRDANDTPQIGDIVAYYYGSSNECAHVGVIVEEVPNQSDPRKKWKIISSSGVVEIFKYGADRTRLGVFGTVDSGGDFQYWDPALNNYIYKIYYAQDDKRR